MSQNYIIQGRAGSMTKLAGIILYKKILSHKAGADVRVVNIIHDEIVLEVSIEWIDKASDWLEHAMVEAGKVFVRSIPMIAHPSVTTTWEHD